MAIITITRVLGSLGEEIAKAVADKLDYNYIDKPEIAQVLTDYGLRVDESFFQKGPTFLAAFSQQRKKSACLIKAAIADLVKNGNSVIFGWGAQVLLNNIPGVLRVRITAPVEVRQRRLMEQNGCDEITAEKMLGKSDRDSAGYISSVFNADWEDTNLYDLIVNTNTISVDTGTGLILNTLGADEFRISPKEISVRLTDLALTHKAQASLLDIAGSGTVNLEVKKGVADLFGLVNSAATKTECESAVASIKGVVKVNNQVRLVKVQE